MSSTNGGEIIGEVLARRGVQFLFTLCGGHISPILLGAKNHGIKVVDVRDEVSAVFAADAVARMTGIPGVAAVTAGPGVTNTVTAVKNAQMAQSPVLVFGGATATVLKGRGSLQDIDQQSLMKPITKWTTSVKTLSSLGPTVDKALNVAQSGVPGPVFIEVPVDLLYSEDVVREWYMKESGVENAKGLGAKALQLYLRGHLYRQFHQPAINLELPLSNMRFPRRHGTTEGVAAAAAAVRKAERPVLVIGSQTLVNSRDASGLARTIEALGMPTFLGGTARGLLGRDSDVQFRHKRTKALREADVVIVTGFPFDFRMGYGRSINNKATLIAANLNAAELRKNRKPEISVEMHPGEFLEELASKLDRPGDWSSWFDTLRGREDARNAEIVDQGTPAESLINPIQFFHRLEQKMSDDSILIVDGGDFVATAAYILKPRKPLSWLDPGVFGTLGVGGGFAVGAASVRPESEIWLIYGDGSCAYSLAEFDTYVRHGMAPIAVVGTDASWGQIARDQVSVLGSDIGTVLLRTAYHEVAAGYGGVGLLLDDVEKIDETIDEAKRLSAEGKPVLLNVHLAKSTFREGSLSM